MLIDARQVAMEQAREQVGLMLKCLFRILQTRRGKPCSAHLLNGDRTIVETRIERLIDSPHSTLPNTFLQLVTPVQQHLLGQCSRCIFEWKECRTVLTVPCSRRILRPTVIAILTLRFCRHRTLLCHQCPYLIYISASPTAYTILDEDSP